MCLFNATFEQLLQKFILSIFILLFAFFLKTIPVVENKSILSEKRFFFFLYYFNMWVEKQKKAIQIKKEAKSPNHSRLLKLHFFFEILVIQKLNTLNSQFFKSICWSFKNISNGATWNVYGVMMMHRLHTQLWCKRPRFD